MSSLVTTTSLVNNRHLYIFILKEANLLISMFQISKKKDITSQTFDIDMLIHNGKIPVADYFIVL